MNNKYVCVHGHFYQPPRENAWLEAVEMQDSAYPDHDWNERITRECYGPNARARVLDAEGRITGLANNYARMSFNFGPTLLAWMKESAPRAYAEVIEGDRASRERFGGHGSAMAQAYNHTIMPLCNERDKLTQVRWGIRDFEARYGRRPEGMWLPETAVDTASLECLAAEGIRFTVLAPRQCAAVRPVGAAEWTDVSGGVDPTRAYLCPLPSGRAIALYFYDGPVSQGVAFEGLLNSGERFAERLLGLLDDGRDHPQLVHIATDGESYGHHHRHGEMALAAALGQIERAEGVSLTNYAQFLELHPPEMEARIVEASSWSCAHGVERWKSDCGCNSGRQGFHQRWRGPLREAFDWLRDSIAAPFEAKGKELLSDPWAARDAYVDVLLERSPASLERFFAAHCTGATSAEERSQVLRLMELQRHALLMYTSCAWFFDDVAGIETTQVIQYAARVVQLASAALGLDLEGGLLERLEHAQGSTPGLENGRVVYERSVRPAVLDLPRVAAHYALSRTFDGSMASVFAFDVEPGEERRRTAGRARLLVGHATFRSRVTLEHSAFSYCVLHPGDHTTSCGVRDFQSVDAFNATAGAAEEPFDRADFTGVLRVMDREFGGGTYSIASLFRDEQHSVVRKILEPTLEQIDGAYRQIYEQHAPMARFLRTLNLPVPRRIQVVNSFVVSQALRRILEQPAPDLVRARELAEEAQREGIPLDEVTVRHAATRALERAASVSAAHAAHPDTLRRLRDLARFTALLPLEVDPWPAQEAVIDRFMPLARRAREGDGAADPLMSAWLQAYDELCAAVRVVA